MAVSPLDASMTLLASANAAPLSPAPCTGRTEMNEKESIVGSSRMEVINNYVGALTRVLLCVEEGTHMCFCDASGDNHLRFRCNMDEELDGPFCFRPDVPEESSSKDHSYTDQALDYKLTYDGNLLGFLSSVGNNGYWLVEMEPGVEEENIIYFFASMPTKILGSKKNVQVCICHVSWEDFGFCHQIDDQCVLEQAGNLHYLLIPCAQSSSADIGNNSVCLDLNWAHAFATIRLFVIVDKTLTNSEVYAYLECTAEEVSASALKEIYSKRVNSSAQTHCPKYSMALSRSLSREPPDVG